MLTVYTGSLLGPDAGIQRIRGRRFSKAPSRGEMIVGAELSSESCRVEQIVVPSWEIPQTSGVHGARSEEHTSELQSRFELVCRLLLEKKNKKGKRIIPVDRKRLAPPSTHGHHRI